MSIRFAILQEIEGKENIVLEYNETQILGRLQSRVRENLTKVEKESPVNLGIDGFMERVFTGMRIGRIEKELNSNKLFSKDEAKESIEGAFSDLVKEFKQETVKL